MAGMWPELLPSSQVRNRAAFEVWKTGLFSIWGITCDRYWSPLEVEQSCMSSQRLGVSHIRLDAVEVEARSEIRLDAFCPAGTTLLHSAGLFRTRARYTKGSCL